MNTKILEYFIAAAEEQNITKAAERCYISQPALSQQIRQLEKELGVPLFIRGVRHMELTDFGKVYLNNAHAILRVEQQTLDKIKNLQETRQNRLRIITAERIKSVLNSFILPRLRERYPDTAVSIFTGSSDISLSYLLQDMADVGIFDLSDPLPPELDSVPLLKQEYAIAVPSGHPLASRKSVSLFECQSEPFILGSSQSELGDSQQQVLNTSGFIPRTLYHADKVRTVAHMIANRAGISLLPAGLPEEAQFGYCSVPLNPPWLFETIFAFPRFAPLSSCGQELLRLLKNFYNPQTEQTFPAADNVPTQRRPHYEKTL